MLEHDFENSVGFWTIMAAESFRRELNQELAPHGITYRQCQVLGSLALESPLSQAVLAERMHIEPPTLVGILDRMERDGWVRRKSCPEDRRKKLVSPLKGVEPVWKKILACGRRVRQRATVGLTTDELATLQRLLDRVRHNLDHEKITREAG